MSKVTKEELTVTYRHGSMPWTVKVPKGQPCKPANYRLSDGSMAYFVERLRDFLTPGSVEMHDCTHYGLVVSESDLEDL